MSEFGPVVTEELATSWKALAEGRSVNKEHAEAMLADLAAFCEFNEAAAGPSSAEALNYREGKRAVFARILFLTEIQGATLARIRRAAIELATEDE